MLLVDGGYKHSTPPSPPEPDPPPPPTEQAKVHTDKEVHEAQQADTEVKQIQSSTTLHGPAKRVAVQEARDAAGKEWGDANAAIHDELSLAAEDPISIPGTDSVAFKSKEIKSRYQADSHVDAAVDFEESQVRTDLTAKFAASQVDAAYKANGPLAAARTLQSQTQNVDAATKARIEALSTNTINPSAAGVAVQVDDAYQHGGAAEAAKVLDEGTAKLGAGDAADVLRIADSTVGKITHDLGERSKRDDEPATKAVTMTERGALGQDEEKTTYVEDPSNQTEFDAIVGHLSNTVERASNDPKYGDEVTRAVSTHIVANVDKKNVGRFDESFETAVASGNGAHLALSVVGGLKADAVGRKANQADDVLQNIVAGAKTLEKNVENSTKTLVEHNQYYFHVNKELGALAPDQAALDKATANFVANEDKSAPNAPDSADKFDGTKFQKDIADLQGKSARLGATLIELSYAKQAGVIDDSMPHAKGVTDLLSKYETDPSKQASLLSNQQVQDKISGFVDKAAQGDEEAKNFLTSLKDATAPVGTGVSLLKNAADIGLTGIAFRSLSLTQAGDKAGALRELEKIKGWAPYLGVKPAELEEGIAAVKNNVLQEGASSEEVIKNRDSLLKELKQKGFDIGTPAGKILGGVGLGINLIGVASAAADLKKGDPAGILKVGSDATGAVLEANGFLKGISSRWEGFYKAHPHVDGALEGLGKVTAVVGTIFSISDAVKAWQTGDTADGVIATAGAAGSVITTGASLLGPSGLAVIGESAATSWTGIGLVVTAGVSIATIGKGLIDSYHETHKFNGEESQQFLRDLGYSDEAAKILAKQDVNDGRTSAQAFGATADLLVEQQVIKDKAEFKDIVNKLAATKEGRKTLEDLVFQAGGIHTNKEGDIPRTDEKADREMQESKGVGEMIISEGGAVYVPQFPRSAKGLALLLGFDGVVSIPPGFYDAVKPA